MTSAVKINKICLNLSKFYQILSKCVPHPPKKPIEIKIWMIRNI